MTQPRFAGQTLYQYTFLDEYSRFRYLEAFEEISILITVFLHHVTAAFPYAIEGVQTDNGPEFTNRLHSSGTAKLTLFEKTLAESGIWHKLIRP